MLDRARRAALAIILVVLAPVTCVTTSHAAPSTSCLIYLRSGSQTCYTPSQFARIEIGAPFALVDPTSSIALSSHLHLSQVSLIAEQSGRLSQLAFIYGVYGVLPHGADLVALPGPGAAAYVLVQEAGGVVVGGEVSIVRTRALGPWTFTARVPSRHFSLLVTSNLSRAIVQTIGTRLLSAATAKAGGPGTPAHQVQVTTRGIRLALSVPRTSYPQNALVRVSVTVSNVTNHPVWLEGGGPPEPGKSFPQVEVVDRNSAVVYPPALPGYFPYPGPGPAIVSLPRGRAITTKAYVILQRSYLRATVPVLKNGQSVGTARVVTTPSLRIQLTASDAPQVHVTIAQGVVSATIEPVVPQPAGRLMHIDAALCGGTNFSQHIDWAPVTSTLTAGCSPLQVWYLAVGYLNHAVAEVSYKPS